MYIVWPYKFINAWGITDQMTGIFVTDVIQATKPCTRFVSACLPL